MVLTILAYVGYDIEREAKSCATSAIRPIRVGSVGSFLCEYSTRVRQANWHRVSGESPVRQANWRRILGGSPIRRRVSRPLLPRAVRGVPRGITRSVGSGLSRQAIEHRKHRIWNDETLGLVEVNIFEPLWRGEGGFHGV